MVTATAQRLAVLVVDDDTDIREALCEVLASEGWPVESASNGREALEQLRSQPGHVGLVVLDLMMPVLNGWEFIAEKDRDAGLAPIPVLVVSASGDVAAVHATGFLPKPLDLERLLAMVAHHAMAAS